MLIIVLPRTHQYMVMSVTHVCLASLGDQRGFQIILQPPYLCSFILVLQRPSRLKGLFRIPLSCNRPVPIIHKEPRLVLVVQWFWPPEVITSPTCYICYIYSYHQAVLGSASTGLIFTRSQDGTQLGQTDPNWPNRAGYSVQHHVPTC